MSTESTTAGYVVRYIVPIHIHVLFKKHLSSAGADHYQAPSLAVTVFTVSASRDDHQKFQKFLQDCRKERRTLIILNRKVEGVRKETEMWGLNLEVEKRGFLFTRATIVGETHILDRLERLLSMESLL
jgi:hypothetical protein